MTNIEKKFEDIVLDNGTTIGVYTKIKNEYPSFLKAVLIALNKIFIGELKNDVLVLEKTDFKSLTLQVGVRKNFIFCGVYQYKKSSVLLLERLETVGTFILDDYKIIRQLQNLKVGSKIGLTRNDNGIDITIPYEITDDLFSE